jgi:NAD(P)H dehydrogenase (quinone)
MTETDQHHYLVTGVTGFQGGAVARALASEGQRVRGLSRGATPAMGGVTMMAGDLADRDDVLRAFEGITHASVVLPLTFNPETVLTYARNIAEAAEGAGVRHLVYNTNIPIPEEPTAYAAFETRREAEAVLRESGLSILVLRPTLYLDNLFSPWNGPALVNDGVLAYPLEEEQRVAWISHADLAVATVAALRREDLAGETVDVAGRESVTGAQLAASFSAVLGRVVSYLPLSVDAFQGGLEQAVGSDVATGVAGIYRYAGEASGRKMFDINPNTAQQRLGIEPRPLAQWIAEQPWEQWRAGAGEESVKSTKT